MYILKNAIKSIIRNKGRNIMIAILVLVIATSACISLSIREAAETAKEDTIGNLSITAQLSFDRASVMEDMRGGTEKDFDRGNFNFSSLAGTTLSMDDYLAYTEYLSDSDGYYYTITTSLNATDDLLPYGEDEQEENIEDKQTFPDRDGTKGMANGDFTITGYSSYSAMLSMFGEDGTYSISDGKMFDETAPEYTCIISDELAMYNNLSAGSVITLENPNFEGETYDITVSGIYTNSSSDIGNSQFSHSDPANNIYMNSYALQAMKDESIAAGNTTTNDRTGEIVSAALGGETTFTYVLANIDNYETFKEKVEAAGLPENYIISSPDLASYEKVLTPLNTISEMTGCFFLIVLIIGGIILVVINMFNLRERKYEVGVLAAIGMKKHKVILQFVCELFIITFAAIIVGASIGATVSVPVANTLLEQQVQKAESSDTQLNENFGFHGEGGFNREMWNDTSNDGASINYVESISSATNLTVILQMILIGALLTIISSMAAMITILRYEPLQILSSRS